MGLLGNKLYKSWSMMKDLELLSNSTRHEIVTLDTPDTALTCVIPPRPMAFASFAKYIRL